MELYKLIHSLCNNHDVIWDCACGNGQVAIDISKYFTRVEASDISESQIANAYKQENISYSIQNSECTNYPKNYFDAICVAQALHWFSSEKFFQEVKRILKRNGLFFSWGYSFFKIDNNIDSILEEHLFRTIDPFWSVNNRILHNEYKSISFPFQRLELPPIKMTEMWSLPQLIGYLDTWSATKLFNEKFNSSITNQIYYELVDVWKSDEVKKIEMDLFVIACKNE
jgi:SAM-dependent methyltransferase